MPVTQAVLTCHRLHNASPPSNLVAYSYHVVHRRFPSPDPTPPSSEEEDNNELTKMEEEAEEEEKDVEQEGATWATVAGAGYPVRLLQECAPGGDELQLREVAKEETNNHILEDGIKAPLDFPAMEESGRHLTEAERNAQM
ncbi:hypothetical protein ACUV84_017934 [Puccinellia chinampoensis]